MTSERQTALEAIPGPPRDPDEAWMRSYSLLREYVDEHRELPKRDTIYKGKKLGIWISTQRLAKRGKGSSKMTKKRQNCLEAIREWVWDREQTWKLSYDLLCKYVDEYRMMPEPKTIYHGKRLGLWVRTQRQARRGTCSAKMTTEHALLLEKISKWCWE